ncbi:MAG: MscL family protein [Clostridia bacterium]|nr:MscL family protein [Clostridia bacterium]
MKKLIEEFKKFIKRGNVVDMAVGVAVASAFTAIVNAFTKGFISPLIALLTGESNLDEVKLIIRPEVTETVGEETVVVQQEVALLWGAFLQAIINFFIIALALFTVMKVVSTIRARAEKFSKDVKNRFSDEDEKAAAKAAAEKAEAEEKARAEAEAAAEAERIAAEEKANEVERLKREEALLTEIRDLLRNKAEK